MSEAREKCGPGRSAAFVSCVCSVLCVFCSFFRESARNRRARKESSRGAGGAGGGATGGGGGSGRGTWYISFSAGVGAWCSISSYTVRHRVSFCSAVSHCSCSTCSEPVQFVDRIRALC